MEFSIEAKKNQQAPTNKEQNEQKMGTLKNRVFPEMNRRLHGREGEQSCGRKKG